MSTLIQNAVLINASGRRKADVLLDEGCIRRIGESLPTGNARLLDANGAFLLPGLIDLHCHLRDPGYEYKEDILTGTRAAAAGGFTSVLCMANTHPVNDCAAVTAYIIKKAMEHGFCRVYPVGAVSKNLEGQELAEMGDMHTAGAIAFSDDGRPISSARLMEIALLYSAAFGSYIISHPEDLSLSEGGVMNRGVTATLLGLPGIPRAAEELMVSRDLLLAEETRGHVHIAHISTSGCVDIIRAAKARGAHITCETTPHYLCLDDTACEGYDTAARVSPPLREKADQEALIEGLLDGTIDAIATDHAPHHRDDKRVEFIQAANGISGFETAFSACYTRLVDSGRMTLETLVDKMCRAPAQIAGIDRGVIAEGQRADLVLVDDGTWIVDAQKFLSKGKNTPFHGKSLKGRILLTMLDGRVTYDRGVL
ncbi:MAG: dihydroorotase [Oscillospiraceae bacterium]